MRLVILLSASMQRRWHEELVGRMRNEVSADTTVRLVADAPTSAHRRLQSLLRWERMLNGVKPSGLERGRLTRTALRDDDEHPDIVLDLTSSPAEGHWRVLYDGRPGEQAAVDALRSGRQPIVSVVDASGRVRAVGRPGSDLPGLMTTSLADLGAGVSSLVVGAVLGSPFAAILPDDSTSADGAGHGERPRSFAVIAVRRLIGAVLRLGYRIGFRSPHWRVGWRRLDGPDSLALGALATTGWQDIPDDGYHFYADPFPFEHEGRLVLFVEDWDHRQQKAVISAVEWGQDGPEGTPRPVLSHDVHLSYPFVIAHAGEVWMIPESSNARTLELYRAVSFPWRWERHSVLLEGMEISDATPFLLDGRWWMTATVGYGGSLSDSLCLWSAPELWGPWTPHAHNPVLVDIASSRPAGRVEIREGRVLRSFQDGRGGYGAAMGTAEITRIDDEGFEQRIISEIRPGEGWTGTRVHTLNAAGGIETIDGTRRVLRFVRRRTMPSARL